MPRLLFEKTGNAVWISHLDLMRVFQRAFKRAGLPLTHTKGFNPRPSVSIALPMSVGVESICELLDFDLEGVEVPMDEICAELNKVLVAGIRVREAYETMGKIRDLSLLKCHLVLEYDHGVPEHAVEEIRELFAQKSLFVEKKGKNGVQEQDIIPMIKQLDVDATQQEIAITALVCCQNPALNPLQLNAALERYLPQLKADYVSCRRVEIYDSYKNIFR